MTGWTGAKSTLAERARVKEVLERQNKERKVLFEKRRQMYLDSRLCPVQKPSSGASNNKVRLKQDRGPALSERTRGNAHPQQTHSRSLMSSSILGITYSPTAGSMDAIKGADLQEVHPWKLLALCSSSDPAINVAAIHAIKEVGRDRLCSALQGGYAELIDRILSEISDPSPDVRSAMAQAFGVLAVEGDEVVVEELMVAADDENDNVRASALSALAMVAPREASGDRCTSLPVQTVLVRTQDDDPDVREAAVFALGALAPIGDKQAVETVLKALEDNNPSVNAAAVDGLILLGDVHELEEGDNQILEMSVQGVQLRDARLEQHNAMPQTSAARVTYVDDRAHSAGGQANDHAAADGRWELSVALETDMVLEGHSGPIQALQHWIMLFGVQDFESRLQGSLADGRSKLLAFVEDSLTVIEGDIETNGRLVFWWPAGARRVLFQTSGDWAWEYRKQCKYFKGYKYLDADTGEELFGSDFSFDLYFFVDTDTKGLWHTIFTRGKEGALRKEVGKFPKPFVFHHYLDMDHRTGFGAGRVPGASLTCSEEFQIDTDVVGGCEAIAVLRLTHHPARPTVNTQSASNRKPSVQGPRVLSTIFHLEKVEIEALQVSQALLSESDLTWFSDTYVLIDPEEDLGNHNQKSMPGADFVLPSPLPPTRSQLFSGKEYFSAKGSISVRMRHSNVEQRIVGGILTRLENENLSVRNAATNAIQQFIGVGNSDAVQGVLRRLEHPEANVRNTTVKALKLVAQVGDEQAMQGCLSRFESKDWFVRASSLEAFFAVCPSEDPRLLEALSKFVDDEDYRVRTQADLLLNQCAKSRKAKDFELSRAAGKKLEEHQCYHAWHAKERALVARQQGTSQTDNAGPA